MARKPKDDTTKAHKVLRSTLHHDGEPYEPGDEVQLTSSDAAPLLAVGAVEAIDAPANEKKD